MLDFTAPQPGTQGWSRVGGAEGGIAIFVVFFTTQIYFNGQ